MSVNGTRIVGSPFPAQVVPGQTDAQQSEVFGHGLNDGVAGQPNRFTIQTKDSYGNRCTKPGDKFGVRVKPIQSLVKELEIYMRKYDVVADITDNEDGTHTVGFQVDCAPPPGASNLAPPDRPPWLASLRRRLCSPRDPLRCTVAAAQMRAFTRSR